MLKKHFALWPVTLALAACVPLTQSSTPAVQPTLALPTATTPAATEPASTPTHEPVPQPTSMNGAACTDPIDVSPQNGMVTYNGVSFRLDPALAYDLAAQVCPTVPYRENQVPGEAHPPYTAFIFPTYARQNIDFRPEVRVYAVTGDMQNFLYPLNSLGDLQTVINQRPEPVTWFDAAPLHTRQKYLSFVNGAGVRGLVQYMQDYFFFTNNGLLYEFNGLTQDGRYFVSVLHPLTVPFLMELEGPDPRTNLNAQAIAIPEWPNDYEQQGKIIQAYNAEALSRLETMRDSDALPDIALLDALVQSIQVTQP